MKWYTLDEQGNEDFSFEVSKARGNNIIKLVPYVNLLIIVSNSVVSVLR